MPRPQHVAIAVVERRGRYLICRRRRQDALGGYWEFPGGKRAPGESWARCLRRELREELGVEVTALRRWMRLDGPSANGPVRLAVYRCALAGRPRPLAAQALRWVPAGQLPRFRFPPANRRLIARLADTVRPR
jgi:mutator protein MutT